MVRIGASPTPVAATAPTLPKVSFTKVEDDAFIGFSGVSDSQSRSYGYNDGSSFKLPEHYIRYIEPLESELAVQVEYDMDEQDQEWLESLNADRKAANIDRVTYETFEIVMDRLEKEWFDLTKNLPKPDLAMPSEDSTCAICDDSEGENTNAIVFCDGCNLAVHQDCYGVPYIPEGQWLCRKCTVSPENPVSCILCPNEGGAFKQTVHGEWVHLLCAIWVPETRVANDVFMEPVTGVDRIPKQRWKLKCSICDIRTGACIQCIKASCFSAFHATCARKEKLLMPMKASQGSEAPTLACYCEKHLPREHAETRLTALESEQNDGNADGTDPNQSSKTARAYAKTYKPGPPLVPKIVVDRIMQYIGKINLRQKREFVVLVCKYWSLKREARRGAPLLKRLHLEPWTASATGRNHSDEDKAFKLKLLKDLRDDLERLKTLSDTVRRREIQKLRQQNCIQHILQRILYPFHPVMRSVFENIKGGDKQDYFLLPVSKVDVPDYYDVIEHPMSWGVIDKKLTEHAYMGLQDFKDDILLVVDNAMLYNKPDTPFYKAAQRIKKAAERVLPELDQFVNDHLQASPLETMNPVLDAQPAPVGDLEPSLRMLDLLINAEHIQGDSPLVVDKEPVESLFGYEYASVKPQRTPPPAPSLSAEPAAPPTKPKRDRKAERERLKERRASAAAVLVAVPPRTRRAKAIAGILPDESFAELSMEPHSGPSSSLSVAETDAMDVDGGQPPTKKKRGPKRAPIVLPGQSDVPPVVDAVDNHRSFDMFDGGWILPEGQKRHNRIVHPSSERPLEAKKSAHSAENDESHTDAEFAAQDDDSVELEELEAGPSISSNVAPPLPPVPTVGQVHEAISPVPVDLPVFSPQAHEVPMDVDSQIIVEPAEDTAQADLSSTDVPEEQPGEVAHEESEPDHEEVQVERVLSEVPDEEPPASDDHSAVVVEEIIDVLAAEDISIDEVEAPTPVEISEVNMDDGEDEIDQQSDLTALSDTESSSKSPLRARGAVALSQGSSLSSGELTELPTPDESEEPLEMQPTADDDAPEAGPSKRSSRRKSTSGKSKAKKKKPIPPLDPEAGKIVLRRGQALLEGGTLVWAKFTGFPWWPGVVFDYDNDIIPEALTAGKTRKQLEEQQLHMVRFFDEHDSWQLIGLDNILMLGEIEQLDDDMLAARSSRQRWKNSKYRDGCRKAYLRARAEMET